MAKSLPRLRTASPDARAAKEGSASWARWRQPAGIGSRFIWYGLICSAAAAETPIKFSLDFKFEGPSAPFLLPLDKGYYKAEGVNVSIDAATGSLESITRVASGIYDMGFADINALIKYPRRQSGGAAQGGVHGL